MPSNTTRTDNGESAGYTVKTPRAIRAAYDEGYAAATAEDAGRIDDAFANGKAEGLAESTEAAYGRGYAAAYAELEARMDAVAKAQATQETLAGVMNDYVLAVVTAANTLRDKSNAIAAQAAK